MGHMGIMHTPEWYMERALAEAYKAYGENETPVGALIVKDGRIIARGRNRREAKQDPTLHAEMEAIRKACRKLGTWRLCGCEMYVTLEPCTMCAGALVQARLPKLYIGAMDRKAGAAGSIIDVLNVERFNHKVDVAYGILEKECSSILKDFFRELRSGMRAKPGKSLGKGPEKP